MAYHKKISISQEQEVNQAFSRQSEIFDRIDKENPILVWMRDRVRKHVLRYSKPGESLLELNAGTGLDAFYFSRLGFRVTATDNSDGMLAQMIFKNDQLPEGQRIVVKKLSYHDLDKLDSIKFDYIFSNFGGLNCTDRLVDIISRLPELLTQGGIATLVIMPRIAPWENLSILKGNKNAFRRWKTGGTPANVEGVKFLTYYYSVADVKSMLKKNFEILSVESLGSAVPPPSMIDFPLKFPALFKFLAKTEEKLGRFWPMNRWCDHFIITFRVRGTE
jgi:SAM-dependent methyltransferase